MLRALTLGVERKETPAAPLRSIEALRQMKKNKERRGEERIVFAYDLPSLVWP
jgi:hypothetical protein